MCADQPNNSEPGEKTYEAADLIDRLKKALRRDGDFPVSAKIVKDISTLTSDPRTTANQLSEIILREPTLGMRLLHVVNSSFYKRAKPIMTVSQAIVQIGMKPLADLCANLVLLQKFVPAARQGGPFSLCLRQTILTTLVSNLVSVEANSGTPGTKTETGQMYGLFSEIGILLLAFYFPQIYENAVKRAEQKKLELNQSILQLTGLSPTQLSLEVLKALELPDYYAKVIEAADTFDKAAPTFQDQKNDISRAAANLYTAKTLSTVISSGKGKEALDATVARLKLHTTLSQSAINSIVGKISDNFNEYCASIDLALPSLPKYLDSYSGEKTVEKESSKESEKEEEDPFTQFVNEIRQAIESREPPASIITTVMETLAWGLGFDRVLLLLVLPGKIQLKGRMLLGKVENFDPTSVSRTLGSDAGPFAPDAIAFLEGRPVFTGDPIIVGGWPIATLPIGFGKRAVGVIYADRVSKGEDELSDREQAAVGVLAELLDRSISMQQG